MSKESTKTVSLPENSKVPQEIPNCKFDRKQQNPKKIPISQFTRKQLSQKKIPDSQFNRKQQFPQNSKFTRKQNTFEY